MEILDPKRRRTEEEMAGRGPEPEMTETTNGPAADPANPVCRDMLELLWFGPATNNSFP